MDDNIKADETNGPIVKPTTPTPTPNPDWRPSESTGKIGSATYEPKPPTTPYPEYSEPKPEDKVEHPWCTPIETPPESRAVEMDLQGKYVMGKKVDGLWHTLDNLKTPVIPDAWRYVGK